MPKKKTHEEFVNEVFSLVGTEYEVLCTYKNATTKILLILFILQECCKMRVNSLK